MSKPLYCVCGHRWDAHHETQIPREWGTAYEYGCLSGCYCTAPRAA